MAKRAKKNKSAKKVMRRAPRLPKAKAPKTTAPGRTPNSGEPFGESQGSLDPIRSAPAHSWRSPEAQLGYSMTANKHWRHDMTGPKLEVPAELRNMAEKTIEQAEKALGMFFDAANKSMDSISYPAAEVPKKVLSLTEHNMRAAFDHARKLAQATDLEEAMRIQSEFLRSQFANATDQMKEITSQVMSATKNATENKP